LAALIAPLEGSPQRNLTRQATPSTWTRLPKMQSSTMKAFVLRSNRLAGKLQKGSRHTQNPVFDGAEPRRRKLTPIFYYRRARSDSDRAGRSKELPIRAAIKGITKKPARVLAPSSIDLHP